MVYAVFAFFFYFLAQYIPNKVVLIAEQFKPVITNIKVKRIIILRLLYVCQIHWYQ